MVDSMPSFIRTGQSGLNSLSGGSFVKLESGKPLNIVPLTGVEPPEHTAPTGKNCVISFMQYTLWMDDLPDGERSPIFPAMGGKYDPGALLGLEPRFRAFLLCTIKGEEEEQILAMGASLFKQLVEIEQALGSSIQGKVIRVTKSGSGMTTKYRAVNTGEIVQIEGVPELDLADNIGPQSREVIVSMLEKVGKWPPPGGDPYLATLAPPADKPKGKKVKDAEEQLPFEVADDDDYVSVDDDADSE